MKDVIWIIIAYVVRIIIAYCRVYLRWNLK